jgi:hypothetical protein
MNVPKTASCKSYELSGTTVYDTTGEVPVFHPVRAPTAEQPQTLLHQIIKRAMKLLTRLGYRVEEQGMTFMAECDT